MLFNSMVNKSLGHKDATRRNSDSSSLTLTLWWPIKQKKIEVDGPRKVEFFVEK
jgi:hypothetical protein